MTKAERGLFETITSYMNLDIRHRNTMRLKEICAEFELAYGGIKNALEHERKCHHAAQDRIAEFEQRLADANETIDVLRDLNDKTSDKLIANRFENLELSKRLAEAEKALEMAKFQGNKYKAENHRCDELRRAVQEWHEQSVSNAYDGIGHALNTLFALQKGPRELTAPLPEKKA